MQRFTTGLILALAVAGCSGDKDQIQTALSEYKLGNWVSSMKAAASMERSDNNALADDARAVAIAAYIGLKGPISNEEMRSIEGTASWLLNVLKADPDKLDDLILLSTSSVGEQFDNAHVVSAGVSLAALSIDHSLVPRPPGTPQPSVLAEGAKALLAKPAKDTSGEVARFWLAVLEHGYPLPVDVSTPFLSSPTGSPAIDLAEQSQRLASSASKARDVANARSASLTASFLRDEAAAFDGIPPFESVFAVVDGVAITWAKVDRPSAAAYLADLSKEELPEGIRERAQSLATRLTASE